MPAFAFRSTLTDSRRRHTMLLMHSLAHRLFASVTAAVVLLTSINCVCSGALFAPADQDGHEARQAAGKPCCAHREDHHQAQDSAPYKHDGSSDHSPACNHCKASSVSESSTSQDFSRHWLSAMDVPALGAATVHRRIVIDLRSHFSFGDLSPPIGPPTLLSLGCSLTL